MPHHVAERLTGGGAHRRVGVGRNVLHRRAVDANGDTRRVQVDERAAEVPVQPLPLGWLAQADLRPLPQVPEHLGRLLAPVPQPRPQRGRRRDPAPQHGGQRVEDRLVQEPFLASDDGLHAFGREPILLGARHVGGRGIRPQCIARDDQPG
jgi:hypothetical protein